jgi:hypothetical protein
LRVVGIGFLATARNDVVVRPFDELVAEAAAADVTGWGSAAGWPRG